MREKMAVQNSRGKKLKKFNYCHIGQTTKEGQLVGYFIVSLRTFVSLCGW